MTCLLQMAWQSGSCTVPHHFHTKLVLYPQAGRDSGRRGRLLTSWDRKGAGLRVLRAAAVTDAAAALGAAAAGFAAGVAVCSHEAAQQHRLLQLLLWLLLVPLHWLLLLLLL